MTKLLIAAAGAVALFALASSQPASAAEKSYSPYTPMPKASSPHAYTPAPKKKGGAENYSPYTPMPSGSESQAQQQQRTQQAQQPQQQNSSPR